MISRFGLLCPLFRFLVKVQASTNSRASCGLFLEKNDWKSPIACVKSVKAELLTSFCLGSNDVVVR